MWRQLTRTLKDSLSRAGYKYVPKSVVTHDCRQVKAVSVLLRNFSNGQECCCSGSTTGKHKNNKRKQSPLNDARIHLLEALGWSGVAIFVGWYLCQPIRRQPGWSSYFERKKAIQALKRPDHYSTFNQTFAKFTNWNFFNNVLPKASAAKKSTAKKTPEELIVLGLEELKDAHKSVVGQLDNFLGTECMQLGKHNEAVTYFTKAVELQVPAAMFNLGICYEMGLGKKQNYQKAASLYKQASDLGHATAKYNLGVFYVHGWGGIQPDTDKARKLFQEAANLGQKDAIHALDLEESEDSDSDSDSDTDTTFCKNRTASEGFFEFDDAVELKSDEDYSIKIEPSSTDKTNLHFQVLNVKLPSIQQDLEAELQECFRSNDSGVLDLSPGCDQGLDIEFLRL